eukprot:3903813-Pleurochrysis_carterae.AAC.8
MQNALKTCVLIAVGLLMPMEFRDISQKTFNSLQDSYKSPWPAPALSASHGQSRGAERCGRRCRCRHLLCRLHHRWPRVGTSAGAALTPCGWAGRARSQYCPGASASY